MIIDDLLFTEEHIWLRVAGDGTATVGLSDFAQEQLGEVIFLDLPEAGKRIICGEEFGSIESVKASTDLLSPLSGEVVEVNGNLAGTPRLVNRSPYDEGWMIRIRMEDQTETHGLMDAETYDYHVKHSAGGDDEKELPLDEEESRMD